MAEYMTIKTVCHRLEKRGHLNALVELISTMKEAEEQELRQEPSSPISLNDRAMMFKDNLKVIMAIVGNSAVGL